MKTVSTKKEFEQAILDHEEKILCKDEAAKPFLRKRKIKRGATIGGVAIAIAGIVAIPLTGGASALASAGIMSGLVVGSVTISAAELAIICGATIAITGILKGGKVKYVSNNDGITVEFTPKYKN